MDVEAVGETGGGAVGYSARSPRQVAVLHLVRGQDGDDVGPGDCLGDRLDGRPASALATEEEPLAQANNLHAGSRAGSERERAPGNRSDDGDLLDWMTDRSASSSQNFSCHDCFTSPLSDR